MDIIEKICRKYETEYNLLPERGSRSFRLSFGPEISPSFACQVEDGLARLSLFPDQRGMEVRLEAPEGEQEAVELLVDGRPCFRLTNRTGRISMAETPISEGAAWAVFLTVNHPDWLEGYGFRGYSLVFGCFSARQQAAALHLKASVEEQYSHSVSAGQIQEVYGRMKELLLPFVRRAPRFSHQPIAEPRFSPTRVFSGSLRQVAGELYGEGDFREELSQYLNQVLQLPEYGICLEEGVECAMAQVRQLPMMAVHYFFTGLRTRADELRQHMEEALGRQWETVVSLTLTPEALSRSFYDLDKAYMGLLAGSLMTEFLYEVCDRSEHDLHREYGDCRRELMKLSGDMNRFCFVRRGCFGKEDWEPLSWKQLAQLRERDIFSRDLSWDKESFDILMNELMGAQAPVLYLCSGELAEQIGLPHLIRPVKALDDRLVWAFWADPTRKGGEG